MELFLFYVVLCYISFIGAIEVLSGVCELSNKPLVNIQTCVETNTTDPASTLIGLLYQTIHQEECKLADPSEYPKHYCPSWEEEFDFIITGAGVAGCVLANRLTEELSCTVLLLEAGGDPTKTTEIPGIYFSLIKSDVAWRFYTEPDDTNCRGFIDGKCPFPTSKVLGGTSSTNGFSYLRGSPQVFDSWAANGLAGWDYQSCLKYFKKSEDWKPKDPPKKSLDYHGVGGYLSVEDFSNGGQGYVIKALEVGALETGYKRNYDFNGKSVMGFGRVQGTKVGKTRCSSAKAFLKPIKDRGNLKVARNSFVTKVLIDKFKKAYGVEFLNSNGDTVRVLAKKEVLVCAGVVNSPKLLMLSGIGPRAHLEGLGIPVEQDLPVGENLVDHASHSGLFISCNHSSKLSTPTDLMYEYLSSENSVLANIDIFNWIYSVNTKDKSSDQPDIYILLTHNEKGNIASLSGFLNDLDLAPEVNQKLYDIINDRMLISTLPLIVYPESKGNILLDSTDPLSPPKIFPCYLNKQEDIETMLRSIDYLYELASTTKLKALDARVEEIAPSACDVHPRGSREFRICAMKYMGTTSFSPIGTCKMGPETDPSSVVDPYFKVIGIDRLRVIDASAMHSTPTFSTQATTYMMAEKAADIMKQFYYG